MDKSRTDIDRIFDRGISNMEHTPRKRLSEAEIAAAAAASKSGAGVFLRSHTKEILLCTISFAAGCLVMIAVLHSSAPKPSEPKTEMTIITEDTVALSTETPENAVETSHETSLPIVKSGTPSDKFEPEASTPSSHIPNRTSTPQTPNTTFLHPASDAPTDNFQLQTPNSPEPVVVKKTIVKRDTVVINETVIIKDTTYVP